MEKYEIVFSGTGPKYIQIVNHVKHYIRNGKISQDEKLPAIRRLASFLDVNKDTVIRAYDKLVDDGAAYKKQGSGTYAKCPDQSLIFKKEYSKVIKNISKVNFKGYIDFTGENVDIQHFKVQVFKDIINRVMERDGIDVFVEKETLGYKGLRECIGEEILNGTESIKNIIVVSGAQQGIDIISKTIININDNVVVERPTYGGALSVFKYRRANVFEVPIEEDGIDLDALEKVLKKNKIKALYTMSYFQNPTGITMSLKKKKKLIQLAKEYDFYIIEDDYLSELRYEEDIEYRTLKSLDKYNKVIYVKSFSKLFLPGIRLGYIIGTKETMENIVKSKINTDIATSSLMQRALELYIREGYWDTQLEFMRSQYREKYEMMKEEIEGQLAPFFHLMDPKGGMSIFLSIKDGEIDDKKLFYNCLKRNVIITPGRIFFNKIRKNERYVRLSFGNLDEKEMRKGIAIIKEEVQKLM